jgi:hypothetical protein
MFVFADLTNGELLRKHAWNLGARSTWQDRPAQNRIRDLRAKELVGCAERPNVRAAKLRGVCEPAQRLTSVADGKAHQRKPRLPTGIPEAIALRRACTSSLSTSLALGNITISAGRLRGAMLRSRFSASFPTFASQIRGIACVLFVF